jgi:hypothetical protein
MRAAFVQRLGSRPLPLARGRETARGAAPLTLSMARDKLTPRFGLKENNLVSRYSTLLLGLLLVTSVRPG